MEKMFKIALDGMGGDFAPANPVKAAVDAINANKNIMVMITGDKERLEAEFAKYEYNKEQIQMYLPEVQERFLLEDRC